MFGFGIDIANVFIIDDNAVESVFFSFKKYDAPHLFSSTEFSKWCFVIVVRWSNSHNQLCSNRISKKKGRPVSYSIFSISYTSIIFFIEFPAFVSLILWCSLFYESNKNCTSLS